MRRIGLFFLTTLFSVPALAQYDATYLLDSSSTVSPGSPTTTIEVWATWWVPISQFVFIVGDYHLTSDDGVFSNPVNILNGPGSSTGVIAGNVISGAVNGQLHIPWLGFWGSRDNPILLATYEWTTSDFTPRTVGLHTSNTTEFEVEEWYAPPHPYHLHLYPDSFTPGSGVIRVVPAPAAWLVLALPLAVATRRRRC